MPEPKQLTAATWRLVLALLMCAVLFCVIRARLSDHIPLTSGHQTRPRQVVLAAVLVRVCAGLFIVGLAVRFIRWFWDGGLTGGRPHRGTSTRQEWASREFADEVPVPGASRRMRSRRRNQARGTEE